MCQFCVVQHSYQKCRLLNAGDGSVGAKLYKLLPNLLRGTSVENDAPVANQRGPHLISETRIIQCSRARHDPNQAHKLLAERRCVELTPMIEGDRETVTEHPEKPCSACQAGDEAVAAALMRELIVVPRQNTSKDQRGEEVAHKKTQKRRSGGQPVRGGVQRIHHGDSPSKKKVHRKHEEGGCCFM